MGFVPPHEMVCARLGSHALPYFFPYLTVGQHGLLLLVLGWALFELTVQIADQALCICAVASAVFSLTARTALSWNPLHYSLLLC